MKTKVTKVNLAKKLGCSHSAIVQWEQNNHIPAAQCMKLEDIIGVPAKNLFDNPEILFSMFDSRTKDTKVSRADKKKNTHKETA